jgi:uncharacterized protein DUF1097
MPQLVALSLSIGVLGGIATFLFLQFMPHYLIWAAFIAWACYFHTGGNAEALKKTITCNIFGALMAWVAGVLLVTVAPPGNASAAVVVGLTVLVLCLAAHLPALATIPASVYGYAAVFAFLLGNAATNLTKDALMSASPANGFVAVAASMVVGALFGHASGMLGAKLTKK